MARRRLSADVQMASETHPQHAISSNRSSTSDEEEQLYDVQLTEQSGLSTKEIKDIIFLTGIYFVQALPLMFSWETIPILLRQHLPYGQIGTFLISQYPYSIKVAWSPIVESVYWPRFGRRKTWLVPCFILAGLIQFWLARKEDSLVIEISDGSPYAMVPLVLSWTLLMYLCSNIRIAVDALALDMLSQSNVHWASTATTTGETVAGFMAFNVFLGVSSFGSHAKTKTNAEEVSTTFFYNACAVAFVVLAAGLLFLQREPRESVDSQKPSVKFSYKIIWRILKLPQMWTLMIVHLLSMIGFQCNDAITVLQLVKYNFSDRDIAGLATLSFPLEVVGGIYIAKYFDRYHPLQVWRKLFPWRLFAAILAQLAVLAIAGYRDSHYRFLIAVVPFCLTKFLETTMFVALVAYHAQISDARFGGLYLPLLATTLNMRYDWMNFIFTKTIGMLDGSEDFTKPTRLIDGYQIVNFSAVCLAIPIFIWFLMPATKRLQEMDPLAWRVVGEDETSDSKGYAMVEMDTEDDSRLMSRRSVEADEHSK